MPWGWECRAKLIKQVPAKPTERQTPISLATATPGPDHYEPQRICGGNGFSKIKRAPAYTFGRVLKYSWKPQSSPNAPLFNFRELTEKGGYKIPGGLITPHIEPVTNKMKVPGPGRYSPKTKIRSKNIPAYSMRLAAKPPYQPFDSWTPPPNMYCPPIPKPRAPAYTLGYHKRMLTKASMPGPGEHNPNFNYVKKKKPAYSLAPRLRRTEYETPPPNAYCEKLYMVNKPSAPAPSFGIRHTPFLGIRPTYLKPSNLELRISKV